MSTFQPYDVAFAALDARMSFVPILADGTKRPAVRWKAYQQQRPTVHEVNTWFFQKPHGIALITGAISGGLEMLDFDSLVIYAAFVARMRQRGLLWLVEHIEGGYKERSPKGMHLYYRCVSTSGNTKLAQRPLQQPPWVRCLIETRGEGGYSIAAPSRGGVHPSGLPYQRVQGRLTTIATIAPEDRACLYAVARTFDAMPPSEPRAPREAHSSPSYVPGKNRERLPGHIFNERATWAQILEPYGWTRVEHHGEEDLWRRPGKERGWSATTNYHDGDHFYVFSTSTIFEPRVGLDKFGVYARLEHGGDFTAASKALAAQGYHD